MNTSSNAGHFFQTTTSLAELERKELKAANTQGNPIRLTSKVLALAAHPQLDESGDVIAVAQSEGTVVIVRLSTNQVLLTLRGPQAPLTSLAIYASKTEDQSSYILNILAGCWDKSIWQWQLPHLGDPSTLKTPTVSSFPAHSDFVKSILVAYTPDKVPIIISGSSDGEIRFWSTKGTPLGVLKPQCRGIETIILDPLSTPEQPVVFFSTSQREIFFFPLPESKAIKTQGITLSPPLIVHETSIYALTFDSEGDLWTASADKTAKHLVRAENWRVDTTLTHPDFVRDIAVHETSGVVITACRDEEIRLWNIGTGALMHVFTGHFEEITSLLVVQPNMLVSAGIDATLRRWDVSLKGIQAAIEDAKNPQIGMADTKEPAMDPMNEFGLTAEEEAELRALMEGEEEDTLEKMSKDVQ